MTQDIIIISCGDSEDDIFYYNPGILKTSRSAFEIGETAGRLLLQNIKSPVVFETQQIVIKDSFTPCQLFEANVFSNKAGSAKLKKDESITVLLPDDYETVNAIKQLLVDFHYQEGIAVRIKSVPLEKLYHFIINNLNDADDPIDAFLFDIPWLARFAERNFMLKLDDYMQADNINADLYSPGLLESFSNVGDHYYALPYLSSTQLMFYRKDLFNDAYLIRQFEDQYKIPMLPPTNWLQYNTIAQFFTRALNPISPVEYGHAMDLFNSSLILCSFLPRLWAYRGEIFGKTGKPTLNTPQAKKAIKNLLDGVITAHPDLFVHPAEAVNKLITGKVAMLTTFFNYATDIVDRDKTQVMGKIGYTSIPGSSPVMGGWSFGINRQTTVPDAAFKFIRWATSSDIAIPHTILGGQSPQIKTYRNYDMASLYPWLPKALSEFKRARTRQAPQEKRLTLYSEELVEEIIAAKLLVLINQTANGNPPDAATIEQALIEMENEILGIKYH